MSPRAGLIEKVDTFQNVLISYSRYETGNVDADDFKRLRAELLSIRPLRRSCPDLCGPIELTQFWGFIKQQSLGLDSRP